MGKVLIAIAACCLASPAWAQDPVKVDPAHHKVEFENSEVRVLRIAFGPGEKAPPHDHPASIAVFLTDARNRVSPVGGTPDDTPRKRGEIVALAAGKHTVENVGTARSEIVLVELKGAARAQGSPLARDAVTVDPKHYRVALENDRVRVLRIAYGPKEKSLMHDHPGAVAVFVTDANVRFTGPAPGAAAERPPMKAGQVIWTDAESHLPENMADRPFEVVLVELKGVARPKM